MLIITSKKRATETVAKTEAEKQKRHESLKMLLSGHTNYVDYITSLPDYQVDWLLFAHNCTIFLCGAAKLFPELEDIIQWPITETSPEQRSYSWLDASLTSHDSTYKEMKAFKEVFAKENVWELQYKNLPLSAIGETGGGSVWPNDCCPYLSFAFQEKKIALLWNERIKEYFKD